MDLVRCCLYRNSYNTLNIFIKLSIRNKPKSYNSCYEKIKTDLKSYYP